MSLFWSRSACRNSHPSIKLLSKSMSIWTHTSTLNSIYSKQLIILPNFHFSKLNSCSIFFFTFIYTTKFPFTQTTKLGVILHFSLFHTCQNQSVDTFKTFHFSLFLLQVYKLNFLSFLAWTILSVYCFMYIFWLPIQQLFFPPISVLCLFFVFCFFNITCIISFWKPSLPCCLAIRNMVRSNMTTTSRHWYWLTYSHMHFISHAAVFK